MHFSKLLFTLSLSLILHPLYAQLNWQNVDAEYGPLPASVHVYKTNSLLDGAPNIAYYFIADLKDKKLEFTTDTVYKRRLTPQQFYWKGRDSAAICNSCRFPLLVVNCTFFSFASNQNLNLVMKKGKLVSYNIHSIYGKGKDTFTYRHPWAAAIGIDKKRRADVAWTLTDSARSVPYASQWPVQPIKDSVLNPGTMDMLSKASVPEHHDPEKWKMQTAVGGGPVLLQNAGIKVTNNEELKFSGKAINDKHPRTAMGYTADHKLVVLVIEGRHPGIAEGATLIQEAQMLKDLGCVEALNLDGGGSSCMLVNGKTTITVSDKEGQRPVPAVFQIFYNGK